MILNWSLAKENQTDTVEKYCPDCGKKVLFFDSGMRRRNANGKDIYEYAIFKCPKEHSSNIKVPVHYDNYIVTKNRPVCQNKLYGMGYHDKKCGKHGRNR
jgi:hypothetical protein